MKKQLLTLVLLVATSVASIAQGTLNLVNSVGTPIRVDTDGNNSGDRAATAADGLRFDIFWGTSADAVNTLVPAGLTIGNTAGVLANAPTVFQLPGTEENTAYYVQMRATTASGFTYATRVAQMTLGPTAGPGYAVWQSASGTNPNKWNPLVIVVPEPSTIALGVLGLSGLVLFRRRK